MKLTGENRQLGQLHWATSLSQAATFAMFKGVQRGAQSYVIRVSKSYL
jgi:hypothetical protein